MKPPITLQDEYLDAALELRDIAEKKRALTERETECKQILRKHIAEGEKAVGPDGTELIAVRRGSMRFSADRAEEVLPAEILATIQVFAPDAKKAKAVLSPALYDLCCDQSAASVVVL